jgi:hypothetical protein
MDRARMVIVSATRMLLLYSTFFAAPESSSPSETLTVFRSHYLTSAATGRLVRLRPAAKI